MQLLLRARGMGIGYSLLLAAVLVDLMDLEHLDQGGAGAVGELLL